MRTGFQPTHGTVSPRLDGDQIRTRLADARLYLCTDARTRPGDLAEFLDAVLAGGVDIVQLREKGLEAREELRLSRCSPMRARRHGALLAVNDRADVALAAGADVLHLGQDDLPVRVARRIVGDEVVIGRSTHDPAQAAAAADRARGRLLLRRAVLADADQAGAARGRAWRWCAHAAAAPARPWFAIGGIENIQRLEEVRAAGAAASWWCARSPRQQIRRPLPPPSRIACDRRALATSGHPWTRCP